MQQYSDPYTSASRGIDQLRDDLAKLVASSGSDPCASAFRALDQLGQDVAKLASQRDALMRQLAARPPYIALAAATLRPAAPDTR
jgi:hypothetical protein